MSKRGEITVAPDRFNGVDWRIWSVGVVTVWVALLSVPATKIYVSESVTDPDLDLGTRIQIPGPASMMRWFYMDGPRNRL